MSALFRSIREKKLLCAIICAIAGAAAGVLNGLLGTGGGIIMVIFLSKLYGGEGGTDTKDIFSTALCCCFLISAASAVFYAASGNLSLYGSEVFVLPAVIGGCIGAILLDRLKAKALRVIFSLLVITSGMLLIFKK